MEVMWVGQRWEDLEIHLEEKKLKQRDIVVYLGGAIRTPTFAGGLQQELKLGGKMNV